MGESVKRDEMSADAERHADFLYGNLPPEIQEMLFDLNSGEPYSLYPTAQLPHTWSKQKDSIRNAAEHVVEVRSHTFLADLWSDNEYESHGSRKISQKEAQNGVDETPTSVELLVELLSFDKCTPGSPCAI